jgi:hypothetical protein
VDPTWNEPIADATHITLSVNDEDEITSEELYGLSMTVVDLTKGPGGVDDPLALARDLPVHLALKPRLGDGCSFVSSSPSHLLSSGLLTRGRSLICLI